MKHRVLHGISRLMASEVKSGEDYGELNRTVSIVITGFDWIDSQSYINRLAFMIKTAAANLQI
jgi:hypothetical protein